MVIKMLKVSNLEITELYGWGMGRRAGYDLDGTIRPKKVLVVDLRKWHFTKQPGEIKICNFLISLMYSVDDKARAKFSF